MGMYKQLVSALANIPECFLCCMHYLSLFGLYVHASGRRQSAALFILPRPCSHARKRKKREAGAYHCETATHDRKHSIIIIIIVLLPAAAAAAAPPTAPPAPPAGCPIRGLNQNGYG